MANTGPDNPTDGLIAMAKRVLEEPPPRKYEPDWTALGGGDQNPIDRAISGFLLAFQRINDTDHDIAYMDWEARQRRANSWVDYLEAHRAPDQESLAQKIAAGGRVDFAADIIGSPKWDEMMTEFHELLAWGARRLDESDRKQTVFRDCLLDISTIIRRSKERMNEIVVQASPEIDKVPAENTEGRDKLIKAARRQVTTVSKTAVGRISTQTRRVLDLDENTTAYTVAEWLEMHGIDTSQPES